MHHTHTHTHHNCLLVTIGFEFIFTCRALEDKKEAFAKAEVERRKEALELRRKGQQEATLRFRNVIRKLPIKPPPPPEKKMIAYPTRGTYKGNIN